MSLYEITCSGYEDSLTLCGHSFSPSAVSEGLACDNAYAICQGTPSFGKFELIHQVSQVHVPTQTSIGFHEKCGKWSNSLTLTL